MSKYNKKQNCSICQFERGKHSFECKYYKEIIPKERAESGESIVDILNEGQREEIEKNKLIARIIEREIEKNDVYHPEKSENEVYRNVKLEELRSKIDEKLNQINALIAQNPKDRSTEKRRIERDTLIWVLQNIP